MERGEEGEETTLDPVRISIGAIGSGRRRVSLVHVSLRAGESSGVFWNSSDRSFIDARFCSAPSGVEDIFALENTARPEPLIYI